MRHIWSLENPSQPKPEGLSYSPSCHHQTFKQGGTAPPDSRIHGCWVLHLSLHQQLQKSSLPPPDLSFPTLETEVPGWAPPRPPANKRQRQDPRPGLLPAAPALPPGVGVISIPGDNRRKPLGGSGQSSRAQATPPCGPTHLQASPRELPSGWVGREPGWPRETGSPALLPGLTLVLRAAGPCRLPVEGLLLSPFSVSRISIIYSVGQTTSWHLSRPPAQGVCAEGTVYEGPKWALLLFKAGYAHP